MVFFCLVGLLYALMPRGSDYGATGVVISPANFEAEVIQSSTPVLAYFWAPW
jgi:thioredoxin-like negative regulator of GroEL